MNHHSLSKRVVFGGYYGMDNVGDNCFGIISTWGAQAYWNANKVFLLSNKKLSGPIKTFACLKKRKNHYKLLVIESLLQILRASCVVWSGGSIFNSKMSVCSLKYMSLFFSKIGITPTGAIGVSLGPYKSVADEKFVHNYLRILRFLALRDRRSYEEALSINLPFKPVLAADLAMLLPKAVPHYRVSRSKKKVIGVTVCHYERYIGMDVENEVRREKKILNSLISLTKKGYNGIFRFFIFNANKIYGDVEITRRFSCKLKELGANVELIQYSTDPIYIWCKISECAAVISTRLHGAIFSAAAGVPCCLVEYHRKCLDFLCDSGVDEKWYIGDAIDSADSISEKLFDLLNYDGFKFYSKRDCLISLSEKNFTLST